MRNTGEIVYLVDDDPRVRQAITELLESFQLTVISFESAASYLAHARVDTAACLVLDLQLPQMNGLDLQKQLGPESGPPIVFISGHGDIPSTVCAMKAGAVEFLTKPVDPEALFTAVRSAFDQDRDRRRQQADLAGLQRRLALLSAREREVLPLVVAGLLNKQSAAILGITEVTLQIHRGQIMRKMAATSFAELVRMSGKLGIVGYTQPHKRPGTADHAPR
jgi:FixJ family two-component response regulator